MSQSPKHPLAEVFGFPTSNFFPEAERYRQNRLLALFDNQEHRHIVNVASVPQRSPFRYPGGKTWIIPQIRLWLSPSMRSTLGLTPIRPSLLLEPFVGGGSVSLAAAAEHLAEHVIMIELDEDVAAVWQTILDEDKLQGNITLICRPFR